MHDPETEHTLCAMIKDSIITIQEMLEKRRFLTALILFYSTIDILGSLLRPKSHPDTSGGDFKAWVNRYIFLGSSLPATADDLWAARCGLLHTNTPDSRNSRTGKAREIHYVKGNKDLAIFMQQEMKRSGEPKVIVDIDSLFDAFINALIKFMHDIKHNPEVRDLAFHHAKAFYSHYNFK
jgi:hypothetical protein